MQRLMRTFLASVFLLCLGAAETSHAQAVKYGQAGMGFLKINASAKSAAMGGTYSGLQGSALNMFANPAGLAFVEGLDVASSVNNWLVDTKHYGAGAAYRAGNLGTFGAGIVWMDYGDFTRTIPYEGTDPELRNQGYIDQGTFSVNEYAVGVSYGRQITSQFYVGGQVRYARQNLGDVVITDPIQGENITAQNEVNNVILDFGTLYYTGFRDLRFGIALRNFSNQSDYYNQRFELPLTYDFGLAMNLLSITDPDYEDNTNALTMAVDAVHVRDYSMRLHTGLEYGFMDTFFLRGGYKFNYDEESFSAGAGLDTVFGGMGLQADYAYSAFGMFEPVHRFTVGLSL